MDPTRALSRTILVLAMLAGIVKGLDLPVATQGTEQWAGVVGQALINGGKNPEEIMQRATNFRSRVMASLQDHARVWTDVMDGNFTGLIEKVLNPKLSISAPVFFDNGAGLITSSGNSLLLLDNWCYKFALP
ncbi:hypothetical protein COCOBI_05-3610 [Coccomyxa sp. Obi]|nr:hypothetical protein COCOBI_05-3610 [Coccomyxa sp. Obi]